MGSLTTYAAFYAGFKTAKRVCLTFWDPVGVVYGGKDGRVFVHVESGAGSIKSSRESLGRDAPEDGRCLASCLDGVSCADVRRPH